MNQNEFYKHSGDTIRHFRDKYQFRLMDINPCSINTREDLKSFIEEIMYDLLDQDEVEFIEDEQTLAKNPNCVKFYAKDKVMSLNIDPKFGHIEIDFFLVLEPLAKHFGKLLKQVHNDQAYVAGNTEEMKEAWQGGFPIHIDGVDFLHKHHNGKRYKKSEIRSEFILEQSISNTYFQKTLLKGLNDFLQIKNKDFAYNDKQLILYTNTVNSITISLNGYYCGSFTRNESSTTFNNCILNQIFLLNHFASTSGNIIKYKPKDGEAIKVEGSLEQFIDDFGK